MSDRCQCGKTNIGNSHQDQSNENGSLQAKLGINDPADEHTDDQGPETDPYVVNRNLVIGIAKIIKEQAESQVCQRVANLMDQDE